MPLNQYLSTTIATILQQVLNEDVLQIIDDAAAEIEPQLTQFIELPQDILDDLENGEDLDFNSVIDDLVRWVTEDDHSRLFEMLELNFFYFHTQIFLLNLIKETDTTIEIKGQDQNWSLVEVPEQLSESIFLPKRRFGDSEDGICFGYGYFEESKPENGLLYLNFSNEEWANKIARNAQRLGIDENLVCNLIEKLIELSDQFSNAPYLMYNNVVSGVNAINALKMHFLIDGYQIHRPVLANIPTDHQLKSDINVSENYKQFEEVYSILSEYNSRDELLNQYMSLFHILENFMIRAKISEIINRNNGKLLSIRDFKRLNTATDDKEEAHLRDLFVSIKNIQMQGANFEQFTRPLFRKLPTTTDFKGEISQFLVGIGYSKGSDNNPIHSIIRLNGNELPKMISKLIYKIRCAIVHNKETEFHISDLTLNSSIEALLVEAVMPVMKRTAFGLIVLPNTPIYYSHQNLELYAS